MLCVACTHRRPASPQPSAGLPPPPSATVQGVAPGEPAPRTLDQMLAGKLAGVSVTPGPHGGIAVRMMGPTSFGASEGPLFIVDGTQAEVSPGGALPWINPQDGESITAFKPTIENVSGDYQMQSFTTDSAGVHKDWVAAGASMEILLTPLSDVIGQLMVPGDTLSMIGTWELSGNIIHFTQDADTFVRDMDWIADKDRLSGDETFGAVRVRVVLTRYSGP